MFDNTMIVKTTDNSSHTVMFNAVGGTLIKSTPESKIIRFHMNSEMAKEFLDANNPHRKTKEKVYYNSSDIRHEGFYYKDITVNITVLQVMLCGGDNFLVEYLDSVCKDNK